MDNKQYQIAMGEALRRLRKDLGLSQEALAEKANVHRTFIGPIENAKRKITIDTLIKLANALGVKPSDVLKETEKTLC